MGEAIRFKINRKKVIEALVFVAERVPRIDAFHVCKVFYFADLNHLRKYGRPVLGDYYFAMDHGPVPTFTLNVTGQKEQFVGAAWLDAARKKISFDESEGHVHLTAKDSFDDSLFSRTDLECLSDAAERYGKMDFLELWRRAHNEKAWKDHYQGSGTSSPIPFEAFIPEGTENREKLIEQIRETASVTEI